MINTLNYLLIDGVLVREKIAERLNIDLYKFENSHYCRNYFWNDFTYMGL